MAFSYITSADFLSLSPSHRLVPHTGKPLCRSRYPKLCSIIAELNIKDHILMCTYIYFLAGVLVV